MENIHNNFIKITQYLNKILLFVIVGVAFVVFIVFVMLPSEKSNAATTNPRCYETGGVQVCHDNLDKSVFYQTPNTEVIYNLQVMKDAGKYFYVYHGEPRKYGLYAGDSVKVAINTNYTFSLPSPKNYVFWHTETDTQSIMYSEKNNNIFNSVSGAGNPMVISGQDGDPYYYVFFLSVAPDKDSDGLYNRDAQNYNFRHYLVQGRTKDFIEFDLKVEGGGGGVWKKFDDTNCPIVSTNGCRPQLVSDTNGNIIRSHKALAPGEGMPCPNNSLLSCFTPNNGINYFSRGSQGLIGSISKVNGVYYYFYTDYGSDPNDYGYYLYYRTATNLNQNNAWSPAKKISSNMIGTGGVRVAKARGLNKWVVVYSCYGPIIGKQDLCIQYTDNLTVEGAGGISSLQNIVSDPFHLVLDYYLGLYLVGDNAHTAAQHFWMTDRDGNLTIPNSDSNVYQTGGELYWSDFLNGGTNVGVYTMPTMRAGWTITPIGQIVAPPTISSFTASPASVTPGQSSTLSWTSTDATSLSINNSVGVVTGLTSKTVTPSQTTTYTLTATNSGGSVTKTVAVTVGTAPTTHQAEGYLDTNSTGTNNCTTLSGWAWDPDFPNTPIQIDIYKSDVFVGSVIAGDLRSDLVTASYGNGLHGFTYTIPTSWKTGTNQKINLYAIDRSIPSDGTPDLTYSPVTINCPAPPPSVCSAPLTQNVTTACDPNSLGVPATSGSVTRSQTKSAYPGCIFPALPVTNSNSGYVSDTCVYPAPVNGHWSTWNPTSCPTTCGLPASTQTRTCTNPTPAFGGTLCTVDGSSATQNCPATSACACPNGATNPTGGCTTCASGFILIPPTTGNCTPVTVSVTATPIIYNTTPGASVSFSYTPTANSTAGTECRLLDNTQTPVVTTYKSTSPISYTVPNSVSSFGYYVQCRDKTTTSATAVSSLITVNTACNAGSDFVSGVCQVTPPPPPSVCSAPLTQNVTTACDNNSLGVPATSGSVTRSQTKSAYPGCIFPALPVTNSNSSYVSDTCVYPAPIQTYTITFNSNGGTSGSTAIQTITSGASANLNSNGFIKTGSTFAGWATTATGAVAYANNASYTMGTSNVTLYAKWTVNNVTFSVTPAPVSNGFISPNTPQSVNSGSTKTFTITPNSGYVISTVTGCGNGTRSGNTYTTGVITSACTVSASFTALANSHFHNYFQVKNVATGLTTDITPATSIVSLDAGASSVAYSPNYTFTTAGEYLVRACADQSDHNDTFGNIIEVNELNNCSNNWVKIIVGNAVVGGISGVCGTENNKVYESASTTFGTNDFCKVGTVISAPNFPEPGGIVTWYCSGLEGGAPSTCSISRKRLPGYVVRVSPSVGGIVKSIDGVGNINCGSNCSSEYEKNSSARLEATPSSSYWRFSNWLGDCALETSNVCTLTVDGNKNVSAKFVPRQFEYIEF